MLSDIRMAESRTASCQGSAYRDVVSTCEWPSSFPIAGRLSPMDRQRFYVFQSTLPREGATGPAQQGVVQGDVSIHAPPRGSDRRKITH